MAAPLLPLTLALPGENLAEGIGKAEVEILIEALEGGRWIGRELPVVHDGAFRLRIRVESFEFTFPPITTDAVRVEITEPQATVVLSEIRVFGPSPK